MSELALKLIAENKKTKAPFLDLGNCGLVNYLPDELFDCDWLEELNLGQSFISRSEVHDEYKDVSNIIANEGKENVILETEYVHLLKLDKLISLGIGNANISNIQFIASFEKLEYLYLAHNRILDISYLKNLKNLKSLYLWDNNINTINALSELVDLEVLHLGMNNIDNIDNLKKLDKLVSLFLWSNPISKCDILKEIQSLKYLFLSDTKIKNFNFLRNDN